uniref:Copine domain-containing protein n=1 Tax=Macrostomum lignano TaxID=282301 RepID=A0A1I8FB90_9PLAT
MFSGTDLCFTVAIDMTASNGSPSQPTSLHYTDPVHAQPVHHRYAKAVARNHFRIYDSLLPAFGFGCRRAARLSVSHEWPLNGDKRQPPFLSRAAAGVLEAYRHCLEEDL